MADLHFELVDPGEFADVGGRPHGRRPGTEGDFGVLAGHAPFMSTMRNGELAIYRTAGGEPERIAVGGGFAEVNERGLTVLAESAEA